jgi:hypothetical protein
MREYILVQGNHRRKLLLLHPVNKTVVGPHSIRGIYTMSISLMCQERQYGIGDNAIEDGGGVYSKRVC